MKKFIKNYGLLFLVVGLIILLDQVTKAIVRANIPFGGWWMPVDWLAPIVRIVHWNNTGAAFGLFQQGGLIFGVMAVIVSGFIIYYFPRVPKKNTWVRISLGMQMAGALGNLIDRLRFGAVTDFVAVGDFPVFNVADSSITVGVAILIIALWVEEWHEKKAAENGKSLPVDEPILQEEDHDPHGL